MIYMEKKLNNYPLKGIKIARVSTVPFFVVTQLKTQLHYLKDAGAYVVIITSPGIEISQIELNDKLKYKSITISRRINLLKDLIALIRLYGYLSKEKFNIIHSTTPKAGLLTAIAGFLANIPVRVHTFTGQQWETLANPMRYVSRISDKIIGLLNTHCYADSESQKQFLVSERIISPKKIGVIGNGSLGGVDLKRFSKRNYSQPKINIIRNELKLEANSFVILYVGRITKDKGINELLYSFRKLISVGKNVELLLIGPTDKDFGMRETISLETISGDSKIHYIGYCTNPEKYMAIANVFCLPSYREGFGTTVIEAAGMELPTVGTKIKGLIDAVENNVTGILVEPQSGDALFNAFIALLDNPVKLKEMGIAARHRCKNLYDSNTINSSLVKEYSRLLNILEKKC
ncbi:MAG: Glycosyl transferases group 1-like protein [Chitinophagaceae bacterium]|nr:MAG: Glycosyl transferases group 1-like protein [Chitinophagaceae bacterium]